MAASGPGFKDGRSKVSLTLLLSLLASAAMLLAFASSASALTFGMMWRNLEPTELEAVQHSGATVFHMPLDMATNGNWSTYDAMFEEAAKRGITILPGLTRSIGKTTPFPTSGEYAAWDAWVAGAVKRYGYNGTFWAGKAYAKPVTAWEVWNEPNLAANNPGGNVVQPENYGRFLVSAAGAIRNAQKEQSGGGTTVLFGGLYMPGGMYYNTFLEKAASVSGGSAAYDGVSIHPYAFAGKVTEMAEEINSVRFALDHHVAGGAGKPLSITELGWPVGGEGVPTVSEAQQGSLLTESFNWIKGAAATDNIQLVTWYNIRDFPGTSWDAFCGLRRDDGTYRPSWWAFQGETGAPKWPGPASPPVRASFADAGDANTVTGWEFGTSGWQQTFLWGHPVAAGTHPVMLKINESLRIFFVDSSRGNKITEWSWNSVTGWQQSFLETDPVAAGSSPSAVVVNGIPQIYFSDAATNRSISVLAYNGSNWQQSRFYGDSVAANSSPSAISNNGTAQVYFADASKGNTIAVWTWGGTLQQSFFYGDTVAANSSPSAISNNGTPQIYFADASKGNIVAAWTWGGSLFMSFLYGDSVAANSSPSATFNNSVAQIYFADKNTNNTMTVWEWGPSLLQQVRLYAHPLVAGTSPGT